MRRDVLAMFGADGLACGRSFVSQSSIEEIFRMLSVRHGCEGMGDTAEFVKSWLANMFVCIVVVAFLGWQGPKFLLGSVLLSHWVFDLYPICTTYSIASVCASWLTHRHVASSLGICWVSSPRRNCPRIRAQIWVSPARLASVISRGPSNN